MTLVKIVRPVGRPLIYFKLVRPVREQRRVHAYKILAGIAIFMWRVQKCFSIVEFSVDYSFYQRVDGLLKKCEAIEEEAEFSDKVTVRASVRLERETELIDSFFSASSGRVLGKRVGETLRAGELLEIP